MRTYIKILVVTLFLAIGFKSLASPILIVGYQPQTPDIDTLQSAMFFPGSMDFSYLHKQFFMKNSFYDIGMKYQINIIKDHPDLDYMVWMQEKPSPMIAIIPGTGAFCSSTLVLALAEIFYKNGFSVLSISSPFNWQFSISASSVLTPGYTKVDSQDAYNALDKIFNSLEVRYKGRITDKILVGYSLGALEALFIADIVSKDKDSKLTFSKYIALNPPVDLLYAVKKIDQYYAVGNSLTRPQLNEIITKGIALLRKLSLGRPMPKIDISNTHARYLIGLGFHFSLSELIYSIETREKQPYIDTDYSWFNRGDLYSKINNFSFYDYLVYIFQPYYKKAKNIDITPKKLNHDAGLHAIQDTLKNNGKIHVFMSADDILIKKTDLEWLEETLGDKITLFKNGGHLGYLRFKQCQDLIIKEVEKK